MWDLLSLGSETDSSRVSYGARSLASIPGKRSVRRQKCARLSAEEGSSS